jgi:hypothetical protein
MVHIVTIEIQRVKSIRVTDYCIKGNIDFLTCDITLGYNKHVGGNAHL